MPHYKRDGVGLGAMGLPIASRLLEAGHRLRIYNRTPKKAAPLITRGAELVGTPAAAVEQHGLLLTMLADDAALEAVTTGADGILDRLDEGGVHAYPMPGSFVKRNEPQNSPYSRSD